MRCLIGQILLFFCSVAVLSAKTFVSEPIEMSMTWGRAGSPYIITNDVLVRAGAQLTIEEGVEILFSTDVQMTVEGAIVALGTSRRPIAVSGLNKGRWQGFFFRKNSNLSGHSVLDTTTSIFEHCIFRGRMYTPTYLIRSDDRAVSLAHCQIFDCQTAIQTERQGRAFVENCRILRCYRPLHVRITSHATVLNCEIKEFALMLVSGSLQFAYNRVERSLSRGKYTGFVVWMVGAGVVNIHHNDFLRASQAAFTLYKISRRSTVLLHNNLFDKNYTHLSLSCEQVNKGKFLLQYNFFYTAKAHNIQLFDDCQSKPDTVQLDSNYFHRVSLEELQNPENIGYSDPRTNAENVLMQIRCRGILESRTRRWLLKK
jgi:hypothetical protein